ncbi:MAG TPA: sugar ABC transporter substrate-binding protein [Streptosporangiaceae bacterium]
MTLSRRGVIRTIGGLALAGVAGCGSRTASATGRGRLRIALANSYIGNSWRIEMENQWKAALEMEPYASQVEGPIYNSNNNLRDQSQQLSNLVSLGVDAICINAASPTALNAIIEQAVRRGILVISFDNTVTARSALKVNTDQFAFGRLLAEHLVQLIGGQGNIIMVTGVPGTTVDAQRNAGAESVWRRTPGVKVVNRYTGMWDSSVARKNTAAVISSLPKIDGIWAQGGTDGVLGAFRSAGRPLPPTCGESENGFRKYLAGMPGYPKVHGLSIGQPPYLAVVALELARRVLRGEYPRRDVIIPFPTVTDSTVRPGVTVFDDVDDGFFTGITDTNPNPAVTMCLASALKGKPCGDRLTVNLPKVTR